MFVYLFLNDIIWQLPVVFLTWSKLFDATLARAGLHGQEVFKPGDLWVRDAAGSAEHGGRPRPLHHLQLGTHVYAREAKWQQVLCWEGDKERNIKNLYRLTVSIKKGKLYQ